jgi:hypothetical protein
MNNVAQSTDPTDPVLQPLPVGAPLGLTTNPLEIDAFALYAANLLGQDWNTISGDRKEEIRQAIVFGLWMADPQSRQILARHIVAETHEDMHLAHWRVRECALVPIRLGLDRAMKAASGLQGHQHRAVVALAEQDVKDAGGASWAGCR